MQNVLQVNLQRLVACHVGEEGSGRPHAQTRSSPTSGAEGHPTLTRSPCHGSLHSSFSRVHHDTLFICAFVKTSMFPTVIFSIFFSLSGPV